MIDISRKTYELNVIGTIADNDKILWLSKKKKHVEEGLGHENLQEITIKFHSDHRKHRH